MLANLLLSCPRCGALRGKKIGVLEVKCRHSVFNAAPLKPLGFKCYDLKADIRERRRVSLLNGCRNI